MALPFVLLHQALQKNQEMADQTRSGTGPNADVIQQSRSGREAAQNRVAESQMRPTGPTGLEGMDVMNPATQRQMQIFNNVMNRYRPQEQAGGMIQ